MGRHRPTLVDFGPHVPKLGTSSCDIGRLSTSAQIWAGFDQLWVELGKIRSELGDIRDIRQTLALEQPFRARDPPILATSARHRRSSTKVGPESANVGPTYVKLCAASTTCRPNLARNRPKVLSLMRLNLYRCRANLGHLERRSDDDLGALSGNGVYFSSAQMFIFGFRPKADVSDASTGDSRPARTRSNRALIWSRPRRR